MKSRPAPAPVFMKSRGKLDICPFYDEIYQCLGLDGFARRIGECLPHELALKLQAHAAEAPEPKHHAGIFEPAKGTKKVLLDPNSSDDKVLTVSANLDPK